MKWLQVLLDKLDKSRKARSPRVKLGRNFNKDHFLAPAHKAQVLGIVAGLPEKVVNYVSRHVLFISTFYKDIQGVKISFRKGKETRKDVIWLNPELWSESEQEIRKVVLHEIAHSYMKHYGDDFDISNPNHDKKMARYFKKFKKTEDEADNKAKEWIEYAKNTRR